MFGDDLHVRQENVGLNYYKYAVFYTIIFPGVHHDKPNHANRILYHKK